MNLPQPKIATGTERAMAQQNKFALVAEHLKDTKEIHVSDSCACAE